MANFFSKKIADYNVIDAMAYTAVTIIVTVVAGYGAMKACDLYEEKTDGSEEKDET